MQEENYDVAVVGGGHAAVEAALAAARAGAKTLMLTINLDHIAQMSCNPCIGGIAKGIVVREIDAMGGAMAAVADASRIQFRMLNRTKGPAVWSPREQCDKVCYQRAMKRVLEQTDNLTIRQGMAMDFLTDETSSAVCGVTDQFGNRFKAKAVVMATGTFLHGKMHYGLQNFAGGRAGDPPSCEISVALKEKLKLKMGRLKTGTPPRLIKNSIDFSKMRVQESDDSEEFFSCFPDDSIHPQTTNRNMPCHMTYTTAETAEFVKANLDKAPMYNGLIEGIGTRYCPSFEDKVVRFPDHERHLLYLEPEGEYTDEYYVNGISTSLPPEIQTAMLHTVPGLEHAEIARYAYAIEYDFVYPDELNRSLAIKKWKGLYHAGQINGTSGYEEAAVQGLIAGLNAARYAQGKSQIEPGRDEAYAGVLIDDLVTKEIVEPYRLFTSRAEYRLSLRQDNADFRLSEKAYNWGILPEHKYRQFKVYSERCAELEEAFKAKHVSGGRSCWDLLKDCNGRFEAIDPAIIPLADLGYNGEDPQERRVMRQLVIRSHYEGYLRQEAIAVGHLRALESWQIPGELDYSTIPGLRNESRMKLKKVMPGTLAQASRIDGVTPAEIALLQVHIARLRKTPKDEA